MRQSVRAFLEERLPAHLIEVLARASDGWRLPLFAFDPTRRSFEPAAELTVEDPETIDALCIASEALSEYGGDGGSDALIDEPERAGSVRFTYEFAPDEADVYERFRALLTKHPGAEAGIEARFQKYPWGFSVHITLSYASDFDFQQKRDAVQTLLLIARKQGEKTPFRGRRL